MSKEEYFTKDEILDELENNIQYYDKNNCFDDLFNDSFNSDYYIIGTFEAAEALKTFKNNIDLDGYETNLDGVFGAINLVIQYERDLIGKVNTEISDPEKLANMVSYIRAENVLNNILNSAGLSIDDEINDKNKKAFMAALNNEKVGD